MGWDALSPSTRVALHAVAGVSAGQVALGITTLLLYVPVGLGAAHQAGALTLWTAYLGLLHTMKKGG